MGQSWTHCCVGVASSPRLSHMFSTTQFAYLYVFLCVLVSVVDDSSQIELLCMERKSV